MPKANQPQTLPIAPRAPSRREVLHLRSIVTELGKAGASCVEPSHLGAARLSCMYSNHGVVNDIEDAGEYRGRIRFENIRRAVSPVMRNPKYHRRSLPSCSHTANDTLLAHFGVV